MIPFSVLRRQKLFAPLFEHVHPLFWPVLWWSLNRLLRWYGSSGYADILFATTDWGYVYVVYTGDKRPDPDAYTPYTPVRPRWDNPIWATSVPETLAPAGQRTPPLRSGGGGSGPRPLTEGASALAPIPNTS